MLALISKWMSPLPNPFHKKQGTSQLARETLPRFLLFSLGNSSFVQLLVVCGIIFPLGGCGGASNGKITRYRVEGKPAPKRRQILRRQINSDPRTLNPMVSYGIPAENVLEDIFTGLTSLGPGGRVRPGIAKNWQISRNGETYTFHLRDNARWSNGKPVVASDFIYAWRREVDPITASDYSQMLTSIDNAKQILAGKVPPSDLGVDAPNPQTLVVHLLRPTPYFLTLLTNPYLYPVYPPALREWGNDWTKPHHLISDGAFMLEAYIPDQRITLVKNRFYWNASHVHLRKVIYYPVADSEDALKRYLDGKLDWTNTFPPKAKEKLERELGPQVVLSPYFGTAMLGINMHKPPFAHDRALRLSLSIALNRKILAKDSTADLGVPAYTLVPPLHDFKPPEPAWRRWPRNIRLAVAKKLYHEAGFSAKDPLVVTLTYPSAGPGLKNFMKTLRNMWREILGAKIKLHAVSWKILISDLQQKKLSLFWYTWFGDYADPYTFLQLLQKGSVLNYGQYDSDRYRNLIVKAESYTRDTNARYRLFKKACIVLNHDAPIVPLYYYVSPHLIKPYVKGWKTNAVDRHLSQYMIIMAHGTR